MCLSFSKLKSQSRMADCWSMMVQPSGELSAACGLLSLSPEQLRQDRPKSRTNLELGKLLYMAFFISQIIASFAIEISVSSLSYLTLSFGVFFSFFALAESQPRDLQITTYK